MLATVLELHSFGFAMRTGGRVQAALWNQQSRHWLPAHNVRLDDFIHVSRGDSSIPDAFGINHQIGAVLALVKAACLVGANCGFQPPLGELFFEQSL